MAAATKRRATRRKVASAKRAVRVARRRQESRAALYDPSVPLAGKALRQAAKKVTDLQFKPKLAALDQQAKTENQQGGRLITRTVGYYKDLASQEADRVARQQALGGMLDTTLKGIGDRTAGEIDKAQADSQAQAAKDAAVRGQGLAGGGDQKVIDELAAQRARAAEGSAAARTSGAVGTAGYGNLVNNLGGARAMHGDETRADLVTRLATKLSAIGAEKKSVKSQRGDAQAKNLLDLRQTGFENSATVAGLQIKRSDLSAQAKKDQAQVDLAEKRLKSANRHNRAQEGLTARGQDVTASGQQLSHADRVAAEAGRNRRDKNKPKKDKKPESQSSKNTKLKIDEARAVIRRLRTAGKSGPEITRSARSHNVSDVVLNAARDLEYLGYVSLPNLAALRRAGIRVDPSWKQKRFRPSRSRDLSVRAG